MTDLPSFARAAWRYLEPVHAVIYFAPEPLEALRAAGFRGFWMGYFAGRAAPLGPVGPEVAAALFYNFDPARVGRALPAAWTFGTPGGALAARQAGSVAALRRLIGELPVARAAALTSRAAEAAPTAGRALAAANQALPIPDDPLATLWLAATVLREHRGDGHVAALLTEGVDGRESHVLHSLATGSPRDIYTTSRDFGDAEWSRCLADLQARNLVRDGGLTDEGRGLKDRVERRTDRLAATAFAGLTDIERSELLEALAPLARAVVRGGDIPLDTPIGLDLREVARSETSRFGSRHAGAD